MKFVLFHGSYGNPEENWLPELKEKLLALGQDVLVPTFPVDTWDDVTLRGNTKPTVNQNLESWLKIFEKEVLSQCKRNGRLCFVAHSLGCVFVLHVLEKYRLTLDSAIFVSPFLENLNTKWQIDHANSTFYKSKFDFGRLKKSVPVSYVLYSDNDPYVDRKISSNFARKLGSSAIIVHRSGHMNSEVNLNEFPLVYELCKTRLDLTLYQKYIEHRRDLFSIDYLKDKKSEEIIYLDPKEVLFEGLFHFRNLRRSGFATLFTGSSFWDAQSLYMKEARKAAKRTNNFIRVYIAEEFMNLRRQDVLDQIRLDMDSGIKVYLCMLSEIKGKVGEIDFGIWDEDYVCTVHFDKNNSASEVVLSSRKKDIGMATKWKETILKLAFPIMNVTTDIEYFINANRKGCFIGTGRTET